MAIQPQGPFVGRQLDLQAIENLHLVNNAADDRVQEVTTKLIKTLQEKLNKSELNNPALRTHIERLTNEIRILNQSKQDEALAALRKENALKEQIHSLQSLVDKMKPIVELMKQISNINREWKVTCPNFIAGGQAFLDWYNGVTFTPLVYLCKNVGKWWPCLLKKTELIDQAETIIRENAI